MTKSLKKTKPAKKSCRHARKTRRRMLEAARLRFCQHSYEQVGVRDIAADANIDAALINRYFGTKEDLFAEISKGVFNAEQFIETAPAKLGEYLARRLMCGSEEKKEGINPFELVLRSAASPTASPIIANQLHKDFVLRLAPLIIRND